MSDGPKLNELLGVWDKAIEIVDRIRPFGGHRCIDPDNAAICVTCRYTERLKDALRDERDKLYRAPNGRV